MKGKIVAVALTIAAGAYLTWPGKDILSYTSCGPKSFFAELSAMMYGRSFWEQALTNARDSVAFHESEKKRVIETFEAARIQRARIRQALQSHASNSSAAHRHADALRDRADDIESNETLRLLSEIHSRAITNIRWCEEVIRTRAGVSSR